MIQFTEVQFGYSRTKTVFRNLSFTISPGHIYGLLGKNGAGKTTMLKLISGLVFPDGGTIRCAGLKPGNREPEWLAGMFVVPETFSLPDISASEFGRIYGAFYPHFSQSLFVANLSGWNVDPGKNCKKLSLGEKQKVMIAFALATGVNYLFLDEPVAHMDILSKTFFRKMLAEAFDDDRLIMISTHMVRDLDSLIDHVLIMDEGRLVVDRSLDEIDNRLSFGRANTVISEDKILWASDEAFAGSVITENLSGIPGKVDMELLFQAVIQSPHIFDAVLTRK
jgi:ABC-2 type transport system ATP-binding protein